MNFKDYQKEASKTIPEGFTKEQMIENAIYGLVGEFGEVVDLLKKARFQGHTLDKEKVILELGDVLWYLAEAATGAELNLYANYKSREGLYKVYEFSKDTEINLIQGICYNSSILYPYRHSENGDSFCRSLTMLLAKLIALAKKFDTTIEEVATKNIEKLRKRYGEKFDSNKSINRIGENK